MDKRPIGIFDSGVGGLTVCKSIRDILPSENIIYFGDTLRFPYGTRSHDTIISYSREISQYLNTRDVKLIVVACNTSSAVALETLRNENTIPIIGVIDAGARAACRRLKGNTIGVIATRATVRSLSYVKAISKISPEIETIQQDASIFVSLTEEGWIDDDVTRLSAKKYLQNMYNSGIRTLILGCTHFPLLKKAINDVYPDLDLVDTGIEVAVEVQRILKEKKLENTGNMGDTILYASDITDVLQRLKEMFFEENSSTISRLIINGQQR
ncbi:MAG: glutamate racemase [Spirochaetota bacterium]|nr:glutamate racemase [Spirochaetota bacterium]